MDEPMTSAATILTLDQRVRVFISSTIEELKAERSVVREAIAELNLHSVMFGDGAHPYPPRTLYRSYLEQSHIYIGVFWESYGWVAPQMDISGIEDEFNLSDRIPRLVYVKQAPEGRDPRMDQLLQRIREASLICYQTFETLEELHALVKNDVIQLLSEAFLLDTKSSISFAVIPPYLETLLEQMKEKKIVRREILLQQIQETLTSEKRLIVIGDPGIGKTYLIGQLGQGLDGLYISLRNRTPQQVFAHLANLLSVRRGGNARSLPSVDSAREALQQELANSSALILIDDADRNPEALQAMAGLEFFESRVVIAARSVSPGSFEDAAKFTVPPFHREEVADYLKLNDVQLTQDELQNLVEASQGNPLFLYYSIHFPASPLPDGLAEYEAALWNQCDSRQQHAINLIVYSVAPLSLSDVHGILNRQQPLTATIMDTKLVLDSGAPLIRLIDDGYEIFHPHFEEYVVSIAQKDGIEQFYHQVLGTYAAEKGRSLPAAYHLQRANDPGMRPFLLSGATAASLQGELFLAETFLTNEIEFASDDNDEVAEGFAHYLLSKVYEDLARLNDADTQLALALDRFESAKDEDWIEIARVSQCVLMTYRGQAMEALAFVHDTARKHAGEHSLREAMLYQNLSYIHLRLSMFNEGAESARIAVDLFEELEDEQGVYSSLTTLAGCAGALGDLQLERQIAERLIEQATAENIPRFKVAGLNHLARVQRLEDDPEGARCSLKECIEICRDKGYLESEALNIANLGNAFLDDELFEQAGVCYLESLSRSIELGLRKNEAHALELIGKLKHYEGDYFGAIEFATQALDLHLSGGERLRLATTLSNLGMSWRKLGGTKEAASYFEQSGEEYAAVGLWNDAADIYARAGTLWNSLGHHRSAIQCAFQVAEKSSESENDTTGRELSGVILPDEQATALGEFYLRILEGFLSRGQRTFLTWLVLNFSRYCKAQFDQIEKAKFAKGLEMIAIGLGESSPSYIVNLLALGIERAGDGLIDALSLDRLAGYSTKATDHLHFRILPDGLHVWTIGLGWQDPLVIQVVGLSEGLITQRLTMTIALIIRTNAKLIEEAIYSLGGNHEQGMTLNVVVQRDFEAATTTKIPKVETDDEFPASISASNVPWGEPQPSTVVIIHDNYERAADWEDSLRNQALRWTLANIHGAIVAHCCHVNRTTTPELARLSREFCDAALSHAVDQSDS